MNRHPPSGRFAGLLFVVAVALGPAPAGAQDSFVRVAEGATGRPVLSVLGTGLGMPFATLVIEMTCPAAQAWMIEVTGIRAEAGTPVAFGFADAAGGWSEVRTAPLGYEPSRVRLSLDRASFRAALAEARAAEPVARNADARVVIGDAVGISVNRDALVREMTAFARECEGSAERAPERPAERPPGRQAARR